MTSEAKNAVPWIYRVATPLWIVLLVLVLNPFAADPVGPTKHLVTCIAAVALTFGWLQGAWRGTFTPWPGLLLFVLLVVAGLTRNPVWVPMLVAGMALRPVLHDDAFRARVLYALIFAATLASVYGMLQWFGLDPFPWAVTDTYEYLGLPATYGNPNFAGHVMGPLLLLGLGFLAGHPTRRGVRFYLACAGLALMVLHLHKTGMRAVPLAVGVGIVVAVTCLLANRLFPRPGAVAYTAVTGGVAAVIVGLYGAYRLLAVNLDAVPPIDSAWILRLHGYQGAAGMVTDAPWLGVGHYGLRAPVYWTDFEQRWFSLYNQFNTHVHNEYLEVATDGGLPALALFLFGLLWIVQQGLARQGALHGRARLLHAGVIAGLTVCLVDALFGFPWQLPISFALFVILLIWMAPPPAQPKRRRWLPLVVPLVALGLAGWTAWDAVQRLAYEHRVFVAQGSAGVAQETENLGAKRSALLTAEANYLRAREIRPKDPVALRGLGRVMLALGQPDRAVEYLEAAYDANLNSPVSAALLALAYRDNAAQTDDPVVRSIHAQMARETAREALMISPYLAAPNEVLGDLAAEEARWVDAADHYAKAAVYSDKTRQPMLERAVKAYIKAGELEAARPLLTALERLRPRNLADVDLRRRVGGHDVRRLVAAFREGVVEHGVDPAWLVAWGELILDAVDGVDGVDGGNGVEGLEADVFLDAALGWPENLSLWRLYHRVVLRAQEEEVFAEELGDPAPGRARALVRRAMDSRDATPAEKEVLVRDWVARCDAGDLSTRDVLWLVSLSVDSKGQYTGVTRALLAALHGREADWDAVIGLTDAPLDGAANMEVSEALRFRAHALLNRNNATAALQAARQAVAAYPTPRARLALAEALAANGETSQAAFLYDAIRNGARVGTPEHATATAALEALENTP